MPEFPGAILHTGATIMEQITLNQAAATGYATPFANIPSVARDMSHPPARPVNAADLLSIAMGFEATASRE